MQLFRILSIAALWSRGFILAIKRAAWTSATARELSAAAVLGRVVVPWTAGAANGFTVTDVISVVMIHSSEMDFKVKRRTGVPAFKN